MGRTTAQAFARDGATVRLIAPLPGERAVHGDFDAQPTARCAMWLTRRRRRRMLGSGLGDQNQADRLIEMLETVAVTA